jgi:hypothetical protein
MAGMKFRATKHYLIAVILWTVIPFLLLTLGGYGLAALGHVLSAVYLWGMAIGWSTGRAAWAVLDVVLGRRELREIVRNDQVNPHILDGELAD